MIVVDQPEVIEISSHLSGRRHRSINVKIRSVRKSRKCGRQRAVLYIFGKRQLRPDSLPFRRVCSQVLNIVDHVRLHLIDRAGQGIDLLKSADITEFLALGVLPRETGRLVRDSLDRDEYPFRQRPCRQVRGQHRQYKNNDNYVQHESDDGLLQFMDRALNTEKSRHISLRVCDRHNRGNMGVQAIPRTQPVDSRILFFLIV